MSKNKNQSNSAETSKIHDNTNTEYTGDTGGTGGIGSAPESSVGDTGGPGGIPEYACTIDTDQNNSNNYPEAVTGFTGETGGVGGTLEPTKVKSCTEAFNEQLAKFGKNNVRTVFHGNTGGIGGIPENIKDLKEEDEKRLKDVLSQKLVEMKTDELLNQLEDGYQIIEEKTYTFRIDIVPHAIRLGMILNVLKGRRVAFKDWSTWVDQNVVKMKKISLRSCQKYMALASTPGVENYTEHGIDALSAACSVYLALSPEDKEKAADDAIGYFLGKFKDEENYEMRREHLRAVVIQKRLARQKILISIETIKAYLAKGDNFTRDLNNHLKTLTGYGEAEQFIEMVIANDGTWKSHLPGDDKSDEDDSENTEVASLSDDSAAEAALANSEEIKIPRLKEQTVTLRDSIKSVMESGSYETEVTPEDIDALIADLIVYKQNIEKANKEKAA